MATPEPYPTGILTLVFTDIEGSSDLGERYRNAFERAREEHNRLIRETAAQWQGLEVKTLGDAFFLVFDRASDAIQFAVETQLRFARHDWSSILPGLAALRIRIGMHTGEAEFRQHPNGAIDYFGPAVNRAARVESAGHGRQILVSNATFELAHPELPEIIAFEDLGVHRMKGVGEERIWQILHPDLPHSFPALKTLNPERHNLPLPHTQYIGHTDEVGEWIQLLRAPTTRLVTFHGFGGIGKTRTALHIAELCIEDFADGVWWIPLHNVTTGDEMVQRIAEQLRLHLQPQPTVREQVWNFHRDRQLLLVLDNLEQIQGDEAAEVVYGLLGAGPRVKILVTSRRSLNLAAERLIELDPLALAEAEALFVERARARKASFALTEQNAADVAAICRNLDGLPLAIEIAASLIVLLAPRQILKRLDDQLNLLIARDPGLPRRQQALRAAIDWSYNLLDEDTRSVFTQLSVFAGGFTLEAAEAVCQAADVIGGVLTLRANSLLRAETDATTQEERLYMLESVRDYAGEKLPDANVHYRHATYFLNFASQRTARLRTRDEVTALYELEAEFDNLRTALEWTAATGQHELCARLAIELHQPLYQRGFWAEARQRLQTGYQAMQTLMAAMELSHLTPAQQSLCANLQYYLASLAYDMGAITEAQQRAESSLTLHCDLHDATGIARTLNLLGVLAVRQKDLEAAQSFYEEAMQLWSEQAGGVRARTLHNIGEVAQRRGLAEEARWFYEESLVHRRQAGDIHGEAATLGNLGVLAWARGDYAEAQRLYAQSLRLHRTLRAPLGIAVMLNNLAEIAQHEGNMKRALILNLHAERIFHDLHSPLAAEATQALHNLREQLGHAAYETLHREVQGIAWETLFDDAE